MSRSTALKSENLGVNFGSGWLFRGLNLSLPSGEIAALLGPSGCGKTTLLKTLCGILSPQEGSVTRTESVSFMPQSAGLFPWLTVYRNLRIATDNRGLSRQDAESEIHLFLRRAGLEGMEKRYPSELSGGMARRVSLLRAFLSGDPLLIMDEPFSGLDFLRKQELLQFLLEIWKEHRRTILFVTHDLDEAMQTADRIYLMGRKVEGIYETLEVPEPRSWQRRSSNDPYVSFQNRILDKFRKEAP